jgi:hypothetical protein
MYLQKTSARWFIGACLSLTIVGGGRGGLGSRSNGLSSTGKAGSTCKLKGQVIWEGNALDLKVLTYEVYKSKETVTDINSLCPKGIAKSNCNYMPNGRRCKVQARRDREEQRKTETRELTRPYLTRDKLYGETCQPLSARRPASSYN